MINRGGRPNSYQLHCELDQVVLYGFFRFIMWFCTLRVTAVMRLALEISDVNSYTHFVSISYIRQYQIDYYGSHVDVSVFTTKPVNSVAVRCAFINWNAQHPLRNSVMTSCRCSPLISYKQAAVCE
jgi:hypothetical protein